MKLQKTILMLLLLLAGSRIYAQGYQLRIQAIHIGIGKKLTDTKTGLYFETTDSVKRENIYSWLWPLCALVQATNEMETLEPNIKYMLPVERAIDQYYSDKAPTPAYQDYVFKERASSRFYDDNEWVAIAYLDAYNRAHKQKYLDAAKMIFKFIESGTDTSAGGGVYWKEGDKTTKNTCSNGPAVLVALQLYRISKQMHYLNTALAIYQWTNKNLQAADGTYYDNIKTTTLTIAKARYTYNTGCMLQANALLYKITKDEKYLNEAERIATNAKIFFFKDGRLPNNYWFNAVMLRGYAELFQIDKNKDWISFFVEDANNIWNTQRDSDNLLGSKLVKSLIDQAAIIEIYARLQQIEGI